MAEFILSEKKGRVGLITLNRPKALQVDVNVSVVVSSTQKMSMVQSASQSPERV